MKTMLLSAVTALALVGSAYAASPDQVSRAGEHQNFGVNIPRRDTGSEAYPGGTSQIVGWNNSAMAASSANHVSTARRVPAYQHGFDTGSEQMPGGMH